MHFCSFLLGANRYFNSFFFPHISIHSIIPLLFLKFFESIYKTNVIKIRTNHLFSSYYYWLGIGNSIRIKKKKIPFKVTIVYCPRRVVESSRRKNERSTRNRSNLFSISFPRFRDRRRNRVVSIHPLFHVSWKERYVSFERPVDD